MKTFIGLIMGSVLTYAFLGFGVKPPEILMFTDKIKALPEQIIALTFLEDSDSNLKQQQHAISTLIKYDAKYFLEIDSLIDYQFTKKAIHNITIRKIDLVKSYSSSLIEKLDAQKYPALQKHYERKFGVKGKEAVLVLLMIDWIKDDEFTHKALQKKYPGLTDTEIAETILDIKKR